MNNPASYTALPKRADVVVIGGGIIGTAMTYELTRAGASVVLVERRDLASGCSGSSAAWLLMHGKSPAWYMEYSRQSASQYATLAKTLNGDIEYNQTGGMTLLFSDEEMARAGELAAIQNEHGLKVQLLNRRQTLEKEPQVGPRVIGSLFCATDGNVNPFQTVLAFARTAREQGAHICLDTEVTAINSSEGRVTGVRTNRGAIETSRVVNAAGVAAPAIVEMAGLGAALVPVRPVRGQELVSERLPRLIHHTVVGFRQTNSGHIISGYMQEEAGYDPANTFAGLRLLGREAVEYFPFMGAVSVIRAFTGLRPIPRDGFPILGTVPGMRGLYVSVMHSGVVLAPIVAQSMTQLVLNDRKVNDIERFSLQRFLDDATTPQHRQGGDQNGL